MKKRMMNDRPLTYIRADETHEEMAFRLVLDHLRFLHRKPRDAEFGSDIIEGARFFVREADKTMVIALDGGRPVACAALADAKHFCQTTTPRGKRAHLLYVYTEKSARHRQVIRQMIQMLHEEARRLGYEEITLRTNEATAMVSSVCEKLGYRVDRHDPDEMYCMM